MMNRLWNGLALAIPVALICWVLLISAAFGSIGGGYIYFYDADQVVVGEWEPFYVYPRMPMAVDYKVGDVIQITWRIIGGETVDGKKVDVTHWTYNRSEADPEFSRYGENWMLFGVFPGYVGTQPGTHVWTAKNQRTGYEWPVLELIQVLPDKRPMPPTLH
jgi:hypothetical protein